MRRKTVKFAFASAMSSLFLMNCGTDKKRPHVEMVHITNARLTEDGYPVITFQITNPYETPICLPMTIFEEGNKYHALMDIRTKYGRRINRKRSRGYPNLSSRDKLLIAPHDQSTHTITIVRRQLRELLSGKSDLTFQFKFWGEHCSSVEYPEGRPVFFATSNRVTIQN